MHLHQGTLGVGLATCTSSKVPASKQRALQAINLSSQRAQCTDMKQLEAEPARSCSSSHLTSPLARVYVGHDCVCCCLLCCCSILVCCMTLGMLCNSLLPAVGEVCPHCQELLSLCRVRPTAVHPLLCVSCVTYGSISKCSAGSS